MGFAAEAMLVLTATAVLLFARRRTRVAHILRGFFAIILLALSLVILGDSFSSWDGIAALVAEHNSPAAINEFLNHFEVEEAITAMACFLTALILFVWPAASSSSAASSQNRRLASQPPAPSAEASAAAPAIELATADGAVAAGKAE
jgi:Na+/phosphate symporter